MISPVAFSHPLHRIWISSPLRRNSPLNIVKIPLTSKRLSTATSPRLVSSPCHRSHSYWATVDWKERIASNSRKRANRRWKLGMRWLRSEETLCVQWRSTDSASNSSIAVFPLRTSLSRPPIFVADSSLTDRSKSYELDRNSFLLRLPLSLSPTSSPPRPLSTNSRIHSISLRPLQLSPSSTLSSLPAPSPTLRYCPNPRPTPQASHPTYEQSSPFSRLPLEITPGHERASGSSRIFFSSPMPHETSSPSPVRQQGCSTNRFGRIRWIESSPPAMDSFRTSSPPSPMTFPPTGIRRLYRNYDQRRQSIRARLC